MYDIEKDIENVAKAIRNAIIIKKMQSITDIARAALNASTAVKELKEAQERIKELEAMNEWQEISVIPEKWETNYLVLSGTYGYQIGYYAPPFKGFESKFDVPDVTHWKPLPTPPKQKD